MPACIAAGAWYGRAVASDGNVPAKCRARSPTLDIPTYLNQLFAEFFDEFFDKFSTFDIIRII